MRRIIKWLIILAIPGGLIAAGLHFGQQYLKAKAIPRFTTVKVTTGKIENVVNSTGPIKPVQSVSVGSFISGPIAEILVDFNTHVKKGQLLALIDPRLSQAAYDRDKANLQTQKAEVNRIEAQLKQALRNEDRAVALRKTNKDYISEQEMDNLHFSRVALEAQLDLAKANVIASTANMKNSETNLEFTRIVSPVDGMVIDRKVDSGQTVASAFQTPEMFIIAPDMEKHMFVYASVDEADIGQIRKSQDEKRPVTFTVDAYPEDIFKGVIFQIRKSAATTQNVVTYPVVIEAPNPDLKLLPGMTASISFQIDVREKIVRIPTAALRYIPQAIHVREEDKQYLDAKPKRDPKKETEEKLSAEQKAEQAKARNKRVVWIKDGDFAKAIPVVIGLSDGQNTELVSGNVKDGDELISGLEGASGRENR
jgi:HlyD family secretion protein